MRAKKLLILFEVILIAITMFGLGCGPAPKHYPIKMDDPYQAEKNWPVGPTYTTSRGDIVWIATSIAIDPTRVARILKGIDYTINYWESYQGVKIPPHNIGIQDHYGFDVRGFQSPYVAGGWVGTYTVEVYVGLDDNLWGLFHEFCHSVFNLWGHDDPRWGSYWYGQNEICAYNISQINKGFASWP